MFGILDCCCKQRRGLAEASRRVCTPEDCLLSEAFVNALTTYEVSFALLPLQSKKENHAKDKKEKKGKKDKDKVWKPAKKGSGKGKPKGKTPHGLL